MMWRLIPIFLSLIFPGAGQIYKREYLKGGFLILLQGTLIFLTVSNLSYELGIAGIPIVWVLSILDAAGFLTYEYLQASDAREKVLVYGVSFVVLALVLILFTGTMWRRNPDRNIAELSQKISSLVANIDGVIYDSSSELEVTGEPLVTESTSPVLPQNDQVEPERKSSSVGDYVVSFGAFALRDNAERQKLRLRQMGLNTILVPIPGKLLVRSDRMSRDDAQALATQMAAQGIECYVAHIDRLRIAIFTPRQGK